MNRKAIGLLLACFTALVLGLALSPVMRARAQAIAGMYLTNGQTIVGVTGAAPTTRTLFDVNGALIVIPKTSAALLIDVASAANVLYLNTDVGTLCRSTGTGPGANVYLSTQASVALRACQ